MRLLRACLKLFLFLIWTALCIPLQTVVLLFHHGRNMYVIPRLYHQVVCKIFHIKVHIEGRPETERQVLFLCNHVSYLDIPVLAGLLPASFVAKSEVAGWPLFGLLAKLHRTVFVRRNRHATLQENEALARRLQEGGSIILFPEGTSSDGSKILPFKSGLFDSFLTDNFRDKIILQGITLILEEVDGKRPANSPQRDLYAWHGDMDLAPHLWAFSQTRGAVIRLVFHPLRGLQALSDRKELALLCHDEIAAALHPLLDSGHKAA